MNKRTWSKIIEYSVEHHLGQEKFVCAAQLASNSTLDVDYIALKQV